MHIVFLTSEYPKENFPHGGIGTFIKTITKELVKYNYKVSVVGMNYFAKNEFEIVDGVNVYRLKSNKFRGLTWFINGLKINQKIREIHKKNPIDVIESAELGLAFIKKIKNIKYIIRLHGGHHFFSESENRKINIWKGFQEKISFKKADAFIAVSNYVKEHTAKYLSYYNKPIKIIKCPIDLGVFKSQSNLRVKKYSILFAGTVCKKKGIKQLILAMPKVVLSYPKVELLIYGRDWMFPNGSSYINFLKEKILPKTGKTAKQINFKGAVPYKILAKKYAKAHLCVFPSLMETLGLVAPEAMAVGRPVIFTKMGPGPEVIKHKNTGLLCNPYDTNDIANAIIWCFKNPKQTEQFAERGKQFVKSHFNIKKQVEENIKFYKSML